MPHRLLLVCIILSLSAPVFGQPANYDELASLFEQWRAFQKPNVVDGVPDYTAAAMQAQHRGLPRYRARLAAIDTTGWSIAQRVDYLLVWAEMNGLDFDHRVLKPWANNPAFYGMLYTYQSDVPEREAPTIEGAVELWQYDFPLSVEDAEKLSAQLAPIPKIYEQAKVNLTGNGQDYWTGAIRTMGQQAQILNGLAERVTGTHEGLDQNIAAAHAAVEDLIKWLKETLPTQTAPSGIGVEAYDWYLKNVHLVPYTWHEIETMLERELTRAHAALRLEEHRNRDLPMLSRADSPEAYKTMMREGIDEYLAFLDEQEIVSMRPFMKQALLEQMGSFSPAEGLRGFFSEVNYRDPMPMRAHHYHWFDLARMRDEPHASPIRRVPLEYNIFDSRAEGMATGWEEMVMHAGLIDDRPRARELMWIMLAQRCARALGGMRMHANRYTMKEAREFASKWTPRGWLPADGGTITGEQHFYLQQPAYSPSYVIGKIQIEHLMADYALQQGDAFTLKGFLDAFDAAGVIPVSLIRWELTGLDDEIKTITE